MWRKEIQMYLKTRDFNLRSLVVYTVVVFQQLKKGEKILLPATAV